jgi:hypothetical protein
MGWLMRQVCDHKTLIKRTIEYNTPTTTSTKIDHEIVCARCGLVFVDMNDYDRLAKIFRSKVD